MISFFKSKNKKPLFSVVIIAYNMAREIPRTVQSFMAPYQTGLQPEDIEIIVMENGSTAPVDADVVAAWPDNVRYIKVQNPHPSPAQALNAGVKLAKADWVCPVIDGARMVTPGIFKAAKELGSAHPNPVVATIGYHIGHQLQQLSVQEGYDQSIEDELLESINWPEDPYKLRDISCLGGSARGMWLWAMAESNVLVMKKAFYESIGGYDERFDIPGGGLVNLDFFKRAIEHAESQYCLLIGEANFHQYHGGVTTSRPVSEPSASNSELTTWDVYTQQYEGIRGEPFKVSKEIPILYGRLTPGERKLVLRAAIAVEENKTRF